MEMMLVDEAFADDELSLGAMEVLNGISREVLEAVFEE
jgi:hypothetical protein